MTIREDGVERRVTAAEAFLLFMTKRGLKGDGASGRAAMAAIEQAKAYGLVGNGVETIDLTRVIVAPGSVTSALEPLRMARKLDRYRETAKMMLEPWLVEMALARLGDRRLTIEQQKEVVSRDTDPVEGAMAGMVGRLTIPSSLRQRDDQKPNRGSADPYFQVRTFEIDEEFLGFRSALPLIAARAHRAARSPALSKQSGKTKSGRGKAVLPGMYNPKIFCALVIAEAWKFIHGKYPTPVNRTAANAAEAYWQASGGSTEGWGNDRLGGWRRYFQNARGLQVDAERAECRRILSAVANYP